jgi:hypothetical protein
MKTKKKSTARAYVEERLSDWKEAKFTAMCSKTLIVGTPEAFEYSGPDPIIDRCLQYLDDSCPEHTHVHA